MKINLNFTIFFTILLASLLLSSCGKKEIFGNCDKICKVRVNIKNGSNFNDENGFGEFNRNGSPPVCSERGVWPSFNLMINGKRMVININNNAMIEKGYQIGLDLKNVLNPNRYIKKF